MRPKRQSAPPIGPTGVGLGLRWEFLEEVLEGPALDVAFFEVIENPRQRRNHPLVSLVALEAADRGEQSRLPR